MKLLEIKNNLVKLSYTETEVPVLGRFIVLSSETKSYVAQFVNLKSDTVSNFAIAKLMFTFTNDGVVDNYDGSIPDINSELSLLPANELLGLLPVENPLKIGVLAQQEDMLIVDASVFERNLTVFAENDLVKTTFISNSIRQLFQMREKSVIIDTCNLFEDYEKIEFGTDFKLPLNSKMIDYIFEQELTEVDAPTKAIIQDIFYAVQEYIRSLDFEFLPIDNFVDVVTNQYRETQMPELALLKNKLLKYRDSNVFANSTEEVFALKEKLESKNCSIIDLKNIPEVLQNEVLSFIHDVLNTFDKYVYCFIPLTDDNSDKKLLKQFLNHNHVFTTLLVSSSYKYAEELKQHAQNLIIFAPNNVNHDFAAYNTFLNKLNPEECIVCGKLTQGIPFIVSMADLELDLTRDDVLGERYQFIPAVENLQLVKIDESGNKIPVTLTPQTDNSQEETTQTPVDEETIASIPVIEQAPIEVVDAVVTEESPQTTQEEPPIFEEETLKIPAENLDTQSETELLEPEMLARDDLSAEVDNPQLISEDMLSRSDLPMGGEVFNPAEGIETYEPENNNNDFESYITEEPQDDNIQEFFEDVDLSEKTQISEEYSAQEEVLTEDDLDFLEDNQLVQPEQQFNIDEAVDLILDEDEQLNSDNNEYNEEVYEEEQTPVVPVYPAEEESNIEEECEFKQGDRVSHHRYGRGVVQKVIKYGNKTLCSISFENVGRRLLDPTITELNKLF